MFFHAAISKSILKLLRSPKEGGGRNTAISRVSIRVAMDTHLHPWNAQPTETRKGERWESNPTGNCLGFRVEGLGFRVAELFDSFSQYHCSYYCNPLPCFVVVFTIMTIAISLTVLVKSSFHIRMLGKSIAWAVDPRTQNPEPQTLQGTP